MNSLLKLVTKFYIKNRDPLPSDIFKSILDSTVYDERWQAPYSLEFYNSNRGLKIAFKSFLGYIIICTIPRTKYYIDREQSLILFKAIKKNIDRHEREDLEKERIRLKESLQQETELNEHGSEKIKLPKPRQAEY